MILNFVGGLTWIMVFLVGLYPVEEFAPKSSPSPRVTPMNISCVQSGFVRYYKFLKL